MFADLFGSCKLTVWTCFRRKAPKLGWFLNTEKNWNPEDAGVEGGGSGSFEGGGGPGYSLLPTLAKNPSPTSTVVGNH